MSLDSIVYCYLRGESVESTAEAYPAVNLEQIHGALAYYLSNRATIDEYLRAGSVEFERLREQARAEPPAFYARLEEAKRNARRSA